MNLSVKKYKHYPRLSEETSCFVADICVDGKVIGEAKNDGRGGSNIYYWTDVQAGIALEKWANEQPTEFEFEKLDQLLDDIFTKMEEEQQYVRWCKKGTYFRLKGDKAGVWRTVRQHKGKAPFTPQIEQWIHKTYGDKLEEILNKRFNA